MAVRCQHGASIGGLKKLGCVCRVADCSRCNETSLSRSVKEWTEVLIAANKHIKAASVVAAARRGTHRAATVQGEVTFLA